MAMFKVHNHNPQKYHIPISIYNPWSTKTIWISQITTGSSLKLGSSFKVLIYPKPGFLRIWNVWKTTQLFVKIKFVPTHVTRKGGIEIMSASWSSHLYTGEICGCVEKAALGGHSTQRVFGEGGQWNNERFLGLASLHKRNLWMCWKCSPWWAQHATPFHQLLGISCNPTHYWRSPY